MPGPGANLNRVPVTDLRYTLLRALYDHPGAHTTVELMGLAGDDAAGWAEYEVHQVLNGLDQTGLVRGDARGGIDWVDIFWALTGKGQDSLAAQHRQS